MPKTVDTSMQRVTEQKREMEEVKQLQSQERLKLEKRKKAIDIELSEIEPTSSRGTASSGQHQTRDSG